MLSNDQRAARAEDALLHHVNLCGDNGDDTDNLIDLLAGLMHWCDRSGADFDRALRLAMMNHEDEVAYEENM